MAFSNLPPELIHHILEYRIRSDWKTCRAHEADLIREVMENILYKLENPDNAELYAYTVEISQWTLFGILYLLLWLENGRKRPCHEEYVYKKWYAQSFMCFEGI